ncbi:hypothetical protein HNQ60_001052 [Povalibacter uvarum]|uniref:YgjP-like metallopeptidase domain-containing protein n=1 Tax=Povalibacter uvarum TaxID=732238 RepID=A0A841HHE8_9GAMM|nr:YgjP-like metallopeptidase domain-containing protein [Povalibacter uvarum]MBB6092206.1 hypothetical protein [Povalibacter uvarum]
MSRLAPPSAQLQLFDARDLGDRWQVRVSRRARRLSVRVYPGGRVEVVVPPGASPMTIERFVGMHRRWIDDRVADLSTVSGVAAETTPSRIHLAAIDRTLIVDYRRTASSEIRAVAVDANKLIVAGVLDNEQRVARAIQRWLMDLAHVELGRVLGEIADRHGFRFERIQIRRQRTRWGSCSASGTISLNVCAMFQDPAVMRYLLIHELSHTRHMNHSRRFWSQVEALEPDYRRLDRELLQGWQRVPGWMFT